MKYVSPCIYNIYSIPVWVREGHYYISKPGLSRSAGGEVTTAPATLRSGLTTPITPRRNLRLPRHSGIHSSRSCRPNSAMS